MSLSDDDDRLLGVTYDDAGTLYASGWAATGDDQAMAAVRFGDDGEPDPTFGTDGVATINVASGGKAAELARSIVVQSDGKVVIAGPAEHDPSAAGDAARDTDIALARFDRAGQLDPSFGQSGIARFDLSTGVADGDSFVGDTAWGLSALDDDRLVVVAAKVGADPGGDRDFAVMRLTPEGAADPSFGTEGVFDLDVGADSGDSPREATVLPDGKLLVSGYSSDADDVVRAVLFRLSADGQLDRTFGTDGVTTAQLLGQVTEAYAAAVIGDHILTAGYGKEAEEDKVDMIIGNFTIDGAVDTGRGEDGLVQVDVAGEDDRGRDLVALPNGDVMVVGSGKTSADNIDAMVMRLTAAGDVDTGYGPEGFQLFELGGPEDSFFSVAVSPDGSEVAVVGYVGQGDDGNDDGVLLLLEP
ncbi:MAG: hypothetical protein ACT4PW_10860 [Acidimicrobiia bacterium]